MIADIHPYNNNNEAYNFFFHPFHFKERTTTVLSIITNIFLTVITLGSYQILFWVINRIEDRKLEVWKKENNEKVSSVSTILHPDKSVEVEPIEVLDTKTSQPSMISIQAKNKISEEVMKVFLEHPNGMQKYGSQICTFIRNCYYFAPSDPFELYIYHVLDCFEFNGEFKNLKQSYNARYETVAENCKINRDDLYEVLETICLAFELSDENLYYNYNNRLTNFPLSFIAMNMLLSHYFRKNEEIVFLDFNGQNYLEGKDPTNKVAISIDLSMAFTSESKIIEFIETILRNELLLHANNRPRAILITFSVIEGTGHQLLLIVEPSNECSTRARITMMNTHGDSLKMNYSHEIAALKAAQSIYHDSQTTVIRNKKKLWATPCCTHNVIDYMRQLVQFSNIQQAIIKGLEPMTASRDAQARVEHGEKIKIFLEEKLSEVSAKISCEFPPSGQKDLTTHDGQDHHDDRDNDQAANS